VEYLHQRNSVGTRRPRFSWLPGHQQKAYELTVADAAGRTVWATGLVESIETALIEYAGKPLESDVLYTWSVRSWSHTGEPGEWATSTFATGLLDPSDWTAPWVEPVQEQTTVERWSFMDWIRGAQPDTDVAERLRPVQLMRQRFDVKGTVARARLYASARGVYTAHVNGSEAGDDVLAPGFDSYEHRISALAYDVTSLLREGENVLAFALADGWWAGRIGITGSSAQFGPTTAAIWQLHLEYADGNKTVVGSGPDVVSAIGPWKYADLFMGEHYDRRLLSPGWTGPDFDDSGWSAVRVLTQDAGTLVPFTGEPIRRVAELPPVDIVAEGDSWIVDFGQVIAGRVRLTIRGAQPGQQIVMEHTEALAAEGSWFVNILGINKEQTDVYVSAGSSEETWEPSFTFHGFRYVRVSGLAGLGTEAVDLTAVVLSSDLEQSGSFMTSDPRLDRLHQNVVWSQRANFLSVPTDCPQRERAGWTGDIQAFAPAATNNAMVAPFLSRWLDNLRADQLPDGRVPIFSPRSPFDAEAAAHSSGFGGIVAAAGWSDAIAFVPWALYERYGDRRVLEENFPAILRWVDYQSRPEYAAGDQFGDWLTPSTFEGRPPEEAIFVAPALTGPFVVPMFRAQTLTIASQIAEVLGLGATAEDLGRSAAALRADFAREHIAPDASLPVELQGIYTLALAFNMVPANRVQACADRLADLVHARGDRLDTGFLSTPYLLDVLWDHGHRELARRLLWQDEQPSWLYQVDNGATTVWEAWDAISRNGDVRPVSLNHYALGCIDDWLYRRIAGLRPTAPGYRQAVIEPDFDSGVADVSAHVGTPYGRLGIRWRRDANEAWVEVEVPHGVSAELLLRGERLALPAGVSSHEVSLQPAFITN
jgi:alpha-L-rhamnosidase